MSLTPILPSPEWPDIPAALLRAINNRLLELDAAISTQPAAASTKGTINNVTIVSQGSIAGLFFTAANRPDANGTPVGTFAYETDTGTLLQVQTVSSAQVWVQVNPWLDDQAGNIYTTDGNVLVGEAAPVSTAAGRTYIGVKGSTGAGVFEACGAATDADATAAGIIQVADSNGADTEKRLVVFQILTDGTTATKRGGRLNIATKADNGGITIWVSLDKAGKCGFGGNTTPAYAVDATGDINASGVFRKGGTAGESTTLTYLTGTPGVGQSSKTVTFSGGIEVAHT